MSETVVSPVPRERPGAGLFSASQVSVPVVAALVLAVAIMLTFDRLWVPAEVPGTLDRYLANDFNRVIAGLFLAAAIYAALQALGLAQDERQLRRLRDPGPPPEPVEKFLAFVSGRTPQAPEDGLLGASRRWYRTVDRAEDYLVLSDHLLAARERQYTLNLGPIQYAAWAMPLLGFIGTVVGISQSIGGLQAVVSDIAGGAAGLESVLGGLQFAFDTTLVGLLLVLPTMAFLMPLRARGEGVAMAFHEALLDEYYTSGAGASRRDP